MSELLSVVTPCYQEEEVVALFHERLKSVLAALGDLEHEILFVDDGSTDGTLERLNELARADARVRVCSLSRNFGHQAALAAGLDFADGDAVVLMDCDLQHPPELIPRLVEAWRAGHDVVATVRTSTDDVGWAKEQLSRAFYRLWNLLGAARLPPGSADFCLVSRRVADLVRGMRERHRFLRGILSWIGFPRAEIPYRAAARVAGGTKYTGVKMLALASDALLSFSSAPLRLATRLGAAVTAAGFCYLAWILGRFVLLGDLVAGWASLIGVTLVLGGCQLLFIGLIGQYLARVFEEVKGRPMYAVKQVPRGLGGGAQECDERDA